MKHWNVYHGVKHLVIITKNDLKILQYCRKYFLAGKQLLNYIYKQSKSGPYEPLLLIISLNGLLFVKFMSLENSCTLFFGATS